MDDVTKTEIKTDKMLSRKEGRIGYRDLQQSRAPQRHVAGHVGGDQPHPRRLRATTTRCAWSCSPARAARLSCRAPTSPSSRASARRWKPPSDYNATVEKAYAGDPGLSQADHRHDPRLLHRRRAGARRVLRPAHLLRQFALRGAGGQARARLFLCRAAAARSTLSDLLSPGRSSSPRASSTPRRPRTWAWSIASCRRPSSRPM